MKKLIIPLILALVPLALFAQTRSVRGVLRPEDKTVSSIFEGEVDYESCFTGERLRIDLMFAGDSENLSAYLSALYREPAWSGAPENVVDKSLYGQFYIEAFNSKELIFSRGFSTLFEEWRTTEQALTTLMATSQTVWMPFPKDPVHIVLYSRERSTGQFSPLLEFDVNPADRHIRPLTESAGKVTTLQQRGDDAHKVDLLILPEGYTAASMPKFRADATRVMEYFFTMEPYASRRDDFNVRIVECASEDEGVTNPLKNQWKTTPMASSYDTFYVDRYLTVLEHSKIADAAAAVPFDALIIIANESTYGGGGIYNSYALGSSDHWLSDPVMIHEFGHSFAGLGDEYYTSEVAYEDFYPAGVEPWEPNVTTLVDFSQKWGDMITEGTPIPTPADSTRLGLVGVYEGAGYMAKGCYRPSYDCRMKTNTAPGFCPVCQRAISNMIDFYTK